MKGYPLAGTRGRGDAGTRGREERFDLTRALGESRAELGFSRGGVAKFLDEGDVVATRAKGVVARARGERFGTSTARDDDFDARPDANRRERIPRDGRNR